MFEWLETLEISDISMFNFGTFMHSLFALKGWFSGYEDWIWIFGLLISYDIWMSMEDTSWYTGWTSLDPSIDWNISPEDNSLNRGWSEFIMFIESSSLWELFSIIEGWTSTFSTISENSSIDSDGFFWIWESLWGRLLGILYSSTFWVNFVFVGEN